MKNLNPGVIHTVYDALGMKKNINSHTVLYISYFGECKEEEEPRRIKNDNIGDLQPGY